MSHDHRKVHWKPIEHTKSNTASQIDKQITNARWPPTMHSIYLQGVHRASCLPGMIPGLGLTLDLIQ